MKIKMANGDAELQVSDTAFGNEYNQALVFQVVNAYRAAGRSGTKAQKSRAEVRGGGRGGQFAGLDARSNGVKRLLESLDGQCPFAWLQPVGKCL